MKMGIKRPNGEVTHEGLVLRLGEHNFSYDSDFYAWVWNEEKGAPEEVEYATTRYPTEHLWARVDATPEVVAKWEAWSAERSKERHIAAARAAYAACVARAKAPAKGVMVKVVKGRKVAKGTIGECIWFGAGRFGERIGIKDAAGTVHWTAASNAEAMDWETVLPRLLEKEGLSGPV